jgi:hypothetical protein
MLRVRSEQAAARDALRQAEFAPPQVVVESLPPPQRIPGPEDGSPAAMLETAGAAGREEAPLPDELAALGLVAIPRQPAAPEPLIAPPFVAAQPVRPPAAPPEIRVAGIGWTDKAAEPPAQPVGTPTPPAPPVADLETLETLRALRTSRNVLEHFVEADPLEMAAWQGLVEQMDDVRLLAELREARGRAAEGSAIKQCLATLEVILLRARHAARPASRVAVQEAIRDSDVLERVGQLQTPAAAGEPS